MERVVGAAAQGAAGAIVGASLSSVTEPIVNRVLVKRQTLSEAVKEVDFGMVKKFFETTIMTNLIKFPFFEVVTMIMSGTTLSGTTRGVVTGAVFTTATLPITNYRYCKSMGLPVDPASLYKAYLPTVLRDMVYGVVRTNVGAMLTSSFPDMAKTVGGRAVLMFFTVAASCLISAPGNEVRGYFLQPPERRKSVKEFFKPERFIRSTSVGALIMSTALSTGSLAIGPMQGLVGKATAYNAANPLSTILVTLFALHQYLAARRSAAVVAALEKKD